MANSDCIVIQGSNMAEAHPVGFQWVVEARARGAKVIHVDPRFTRTSANADKHITTRSGTDVVLLGALIRSVLEEGKWFDEYVRHYTNAANLIREEYQDTEDLDGLFSGLDKERLAYDNSSWQYELDEKGEPVVDMTLEHPRSVFQILKRHYQRYTPEMVERACGISRADYDYLFKAVTENSGRERTTCFAYAVGWTQHTLGAQFIRTAAILQLLLGNMGRPGGGIMALRGHATIQGSTDIPTLFNLLPGYLPMPSASGEAHLMDYVSAIGTPETQRGFWANSDAYMTSLLKAWFGDKATEENNFYYDNLPRINGAHGTYQTALRMLDGGVDGYFLLGQNPAVGSANGRLQRMSMSHLKWLVVRDFSMIESATWWKSGPEIESGELKTEDIETEVFFLPAANHTEKAGTFTQTQRLVQWRFKAVDPPGDARSELEFFFELGNRIRERLKDSDDPRDRPLLDLTWDYPLDESGEIDPEAVMKEINGYFIGGDRDGEPVDGFGDLKADGSTASGCWIYSGVYAGGKNMAARKKPGFEQDEMAAEWAWAWPANRRILYNRASADLDGRPWSERKKLLWWDPTEGKWVGPDVPDFPVDRNPHFRDKSAYGGTAALRGDDPFIMQPDGKGWLFAPKGMVDGPLPTHFEPQESRVRNPLYAQQNSPTRRTMPREDNLMAPGVEGPEQAVFPHMFTTYRLTEHHTAGGMSRWLPYLSELQPEFFCEVSEELAQEVGLEPYGWATLISPRAVVEARVLVTKRIRPVQIDGHTVHQIGMPYHWGVGGDGAVVQGDSANDLIGVTMDPNVFIQNSKSNAVAIVPGRRPRGKARLELLNEYRTKAGLTPRSGNEHLTAPQADVLKSEALMDVPVQPGEKFLEEEERRAEEEEQQKLRAEAEARGEHVGPHGPGCKCDQIPEGADFKRAGRYSGSGDDVGGAEVGNRSHPGHQVNTSGHSRQGGKEDQGANPNASQKQAEEDEEK